LAPLDAVTPVPPDPTPNVPASVTSPVAALVGVKPLKDVKNDVTPAVPDEEIVPPDKSKPAPTVIADGAAVAVPGLPNKELPAISARTMVPDVVIGPPESPVPVLMLVTVPEPAEIEIVPPKETGVLLIVIALLARALLGMAVKPVPIAPDVSVPTPLMPL
jgi:hypothetical protein